MTPTLMLSTTKDKIFKIVNDDSIDNIIEMSIMSAWLSYDSIWFSGPEKQEILILITPVMMDFILLLFYLLHVAASLQCHSRHPPDEEAGHEQRGKPEPEDSRHHATGTNRREQVTSHHHPLHRLFTTRVCCEGSLLLYAALRMDGTSPGLV
jgi:hypothetical protein